MPFHQVCIADGRAATKAVIRGAVSVLSLPFLSTPIPAEAASGPDASDGSEPWNTGWSFYLDNDALTLVNRDQQYTGGFAITLSGRRAVEYPVSIDAALGWLDELTGFAALSAHGRRTTRHSIEFGATSFTPDEIEKSGPIRDDHPYANVAFISNTRRTVLLDERVSYQSTLAIGLLGTDFAKGVQKVFHDLTGDRKPQGWDNHISDGGEPTFLYAVNRQQPVWIDQDNRGLDHDIRITIGASLGHTTQVVAGINWR